MVEHRLAKARVASFNDESALDKLYDAYMANDTINLLHEDFDYMIRL